MTTETQNDTSNQIAEYNPVAAALAELREKFADVIFPVTTKEGMKDAKDVRGKLVKLRTGLESMRKDIKEPALRRTQAIDAEAKAITAAIKAIEEPIDAQIKVEEQRIEAEKAAKAEKVAEIQRKIDGIRGLPLELAGSTAEEVDAELIALSDFEPLAEVFGDLLNDCQMAIAETTTALEDLYQRVQAQEAAAAQVEVQRLALEELAKVERAAIAAQRESMDEERRAFEAERAEFAAMKAAAALDVAQPGAVTEPSVTQATVEEAPEIEVAPEAEAVSSWDDTPEEIAAATAAPIIEWRIRQAAMHTASQFTAFAHKCHTCGAAEFADQLLSVAGALRNGQFDAALAAANVVTLIDCDNALLDATIACIDSLDSEEEKVAA